MVLRLKVRSLLALLNGKDDPEIEVTQEFVAELLAGKDPREIVDFMMANMNGHADDSDDGDEVVIEIDETDTSEPSISIESGRTKRFDPGDGRSTRRASKQTIQDWYLLSVAPQMTGCSEEYIRGLITDNEIDNYRIGRFTYVHARQVIYYREHGHSFEVDLNVFDEWVPMGRIVKMFKSVNFQKLYAVIDDGKLAYHCAGNTVFMNVLECIEMFG